MKREKTQCKNTHKTHHTLKKDQRLIENTSEKGLHSSIRKLYIIPMVEGQKKTKNLHAPPQTSMNAQVYQTESYLPHQIKPMAKSVKLHTQCILKAFPQYIHTCTHTHTLAIFSYHLEMEFQIAGINSDCISLFHNVFTRKLCSLPDSKGV